MARSFDIIDSLGGQDPEDHLSNILKDHGGGRILPRHARPGEFSQTGMTDTRLIAKPNSPVWKLAAAAVEAVTPPTHDVAFEQTA